MTDKSFSDNSWYDQTISDIRTIRFSNPEKVLSLARGMMARAESERNTGMIGLAQFWIGDAYFTLMDSENSIVHIHEAMKSLNDAGDYNHLGQCYNLLGIIFTHQGDNSSAFQSYIKGISILRDHPEYNHLGAMLYENYAELCERTGNPLDARKMYLRSLIYCERLHTKDSPYSGLLPVLYREMVLLEICLGNEGEAREYLRRLNREIVDSKEEKECFEQYVVLLLFSAFKGRKERAEFYEKQALDSYLKLEYPIDAFWTTISFLNHLESEEKYSEMKTVLDHMDHGLDRDDFPDFQARLTGYRIRMAEFYGNREEELIQCRRYRHFMTERTRIQNHTLNFLMEMQKSLDQSEEQNILLEKRANTDALTGIPNRVHYNETADRLLQQCLQKQEIFAIEMMDVDHFKQINDTFGHRAGDLVLKVVADSLRKPVSDRVQVFRYGGDEFTILYIGMAEEEIRKTAEKLRSDIYSSLESSKLPEATVSQGVCYALPTKLNRVWDFASQADAAMYQMKRSGGDQIRIVTKETFVLPSYGGESGEDE
jgi:diguanylate cyclase (GGDEF)-like protein